MTTNEVRAAIRDAEQERDQLRGEMDDEADDNGGHIDAERAARFHDRLEDIDGKLWRLKSLLRTPVPT